MVREILRIYTDNGLSDNPSFHGIELSEYEYKPSRMGMPTLTATLMWDKCLNDEWSGREYVELRGERFYIRHTPSSEKNNTDERYKHSIEFRSEFDEILSNVYFEDYVPSMLLGSVLTYDKPCSNSSVFTFYGTIQEFSDRLNCAFLKAGVGDSILKDKTDLTTLDTPKGDGYCSMIDPFGDYDPDKSYEFSFENQFLWEAITSAYNTTEIQFRREGRKIIWGAESKVLARTFKYGHDNELLKVGMNNANAKVINRITMLGSSENIPYYYPNETEYGHIEVSATSGNKVISTAMIEVVNRTQMLAYLTPDTKAVLGKLTEEEMSGKGTGTADITSYEIAFGEQVFSPYTKGKTVSYTPAATNPNPYWRIRIHFKTDGSKRNLLSELDGQVWYTNSSYGSPSYISILSGCEIVSLTTIENGSTKDITEKVEKTDEGIDLGSLESGEYTLTVRVRFNSSEAYGYTAYCVLYGSEITTGGIEEIVSAKLKSPYYWKVGEKIYYGEGSLGIKIKGGVTGSMIGDGFQWTATGRMPFQERLVPPKYRNTEGAERFYNAYNEPYSEPYANAHKDAYIDPDTDEAYVFDNPFTEGAPVEHIYENEDIKPTIEGVRNAEGLLMGSIADIAFDANDNDSIAPENTDEDKNDSLKYEHSYFYIRLNKFDGDYGFDLIKHYSQTDPMTLQMTSGPCNGCKFKVQVVEFDDDTGLKYYKNPVQVNPDGSIVKGGYSDKVNKNNIIESQQNTQTNSIWLCVQKDAETFGVLMPNQEHKYLPKIGDTFNIINIDLPDAYIYAAEKRLEEEGMRYMSDNNEEKFTFDINASRVFFAEHPEVLEQLDEYSKIRVEYDGRTYELFVSSLAISCKNNEPLPEIKIDLSDTIAVGQSFQQRMEERAQSLIANASNLGGGAGGTGGLSTALTDRRYLNKMKADRTPHKLSTDTAFEVGEFVSGASGGIFYRDPETGQTYIEVDKLKVRLKAIFEELEIAHTSSIGGQQIITPGGGIEISYVEERTDVYRCYFKAKEESEGAECRFKAGDQVKCQEFNIQAGTHQNASNKYYWRLVVAVNNDESYVDISKTDCDNGSDVPEAGDTVVQLGNRDDKTRQSAIVHSTVDAFAPCVTLFDGINSYSLEGKEVIQYGVDKTKNPPQPFFHCYGSFYYGPRNRTSFLEFDPAVGYLVFKGTLLLQSTVQDDKGNSQSMQDYLDNLIKDNTLSEKEVRDIADAVAKAVGDDLQNQIDGKIETWFGDEEPSLNPTGYPMREWEEAGRDWNDILEAHSGDLYYDNTTGYAYRFSKENGQWTWITITDDAITKALEMAGQKRRIFTDIPKPPYDKDDLWVNATYPKGASKENATYYNEILVCKTGRQSGDFVLSDWGYASDYTNDDYAHTFDFLTQSLKDAKKQSTLIDGGLILSSHIRLGQGVGDEWQCWSGISGLVYPSEKGMGIASWYGGDPIDGEDKKWVIPNPSNPPRYAQTLFRFDGSGYLAGGQIYWDEKGNLYLNNGIQLEGGDDLKTLGSIVTFLNYFSINFKPVKINGSTVTEIDWRDIKSYDDFDALKSRKGFYSEEFISALGLNDNAGGSGGGSSTLTGLDDVKLNNLTLANGQSLVYRNGYWVNETVQSGGGGDLSGYLPLTGGTLKGNLEILNANFSVSTDKGGLGVNIQTDTYFGPATASNGLFSLGRATARWSTVYANTINVSSNGLVSNLNAQYLNGKQSSEYQRDLYFYTGATAFAGDSTLNPNILGYYDNQQNFRFIDTKFYGSVSESASRFQIAYPYNSLANIIYRYYNNGWSGWKTIANTDSNVASASQLQTIRYIWGQGFNGTGDVSGAMSNVTSITMSGVITQKWIDSTAGYRVLADFCRNHPSSASAYISHLYLGAYSNSGSASYGYIQSQNNNTTQALLLNPEGGNVGIGTVNPTSKLQVSGGIYSTGDMQTEGSVWADIEVYAQDGIYTDGYMSCMGQNTSSDERLKTNFRPLNLSLAQIANAPCISFHWKKDGVEDIGSIAQYWQRNLPLSVRKDHNDFLALDYGKTALLSVISVAKEVMNDKERIRILEMKVRELEQKLREA